MAGEGEHVDVVRRYVYGQVAHRLDRVGVEKDPPCEHLEENMARVSAMRDKLIDGLSKIPRSRCNGSPDHRAPGIVSCLLVGILHGLQHVGPHGAHLPQSAHHLRHLLENVVHLFHGVVLGQAQPQGAVGDLVGHTQGQQHVAGVQGAAGAGATGAGADARQIQTQQQALPLDALTWRIPTNKQDFHPDQKGRLDAMAMEYSEKVMEHFARPHNVGTLEDANGVGEVGNAKCGDIMRMYLKISDDEVIEEPLVRKLDNPIIGHSPQRAAGSGQTGAVKPGIKRPSQSGGPGDARGAERSENLLACKTPAIIAFPL